MVSGANPETILEDIVLKESLEESNEQQKSIEQALEEQKQQMRSIDILTDSFLPLAIRGQRLFFVLDKLINVDPMYQYSLDYFRGIFRNAIKSIDEEEYPKKEGKRRLGYFIKEFTHRLYKNVCRSLFEKDKLIYSFLITLEIMDQNKKDEVKKEDNKKGGADNKDNHGEEAGLNKNEIRWLLTGAVKVTCDRPNPSGENGWLSDIQWAAIEEMSQKFDSFKGFDSDFEKYTSDWEKVYNDSNPHDEESLK